MLRSTDCRGAFAETVELQGRGDALPSPVADETADLGLETDVDRTGSEAVRPDEIRLAVPGLLEVRQGAVEWVRVEDVVMAGQRPIRSEAEIGIQHFQPRPVPHRTAPRPDTVGKACIERTRRCRGQRHQYHSRNANPPAHRTADYLTRTNLSTLRSTVSPA